MVTPEECPLVGETIHHGVLSLTVPAPGHQVGVTALERRGEVKLRVTTRPDGVVVIDTGTSIRPPLLR